MPKYSPDFTVSAKKPKSKGLDAVSQIQSITGKRAEKNFAPMQQNWFPLISSLARWCDRRSPLAQSPSFVSWIRPWAYRQWMEKQQLRRAAEPLVGLWILGISCLSCGVCSIEIHFLSGTWDTSHIRYQLHHCKNSQNTAGGNIWNLHPDTNKGYCSPAVSGAAMQAAGDFGLVPLWLASCSNSAGHAPCAQKAVQKLRWSQPALGGWEMMDWDADHHLYRQMSWMRPARSLSLQIWDKGKRFFQQQPGSTCDLK